MSKPVRPTADCEAEIHAAIAWYEGERLGLGRELWDEIQKTIDLITDHPAIGNVVRRARVKGVARRVPLRRFPYFVVYREKPEYVELVALAHMSRRPGYWRFRLA
ncbi:MAG TPA: type II toxin-antitoxin system RelE/ParE family toxin [Thermoanaerobaculia bacterium]|nr:type II toxin-antitoxin system RelE/ParE family toxin [Thermoanaerobaculia bacterium]